MLNVIYERSLATLNDPDVNVITARCHVPLFGRWVKLQITTYSLAGGTAITFGVEPSDESDIKRDRNHASCSGAIRLARGSAGNRQNFEQEIVVPHLIGQLLDWSELVDGDLQAGRTVADAIQRRTESIVETVRQNIRRNLGSDAREQALTVLNERYGNQTYETVRTFLGQINWRLMLDGAGLGDDAATFIDHELEHTAIRIFRITRDDNTGIPLVANCPVNRFDRTTLANIKATTLLTKVCGSKLGKMFNEIGKIVVYENDYRFDIRPGEFVKVTDPNGKTARFCIHTIRCSCNPIDEVIISYLHIRNKFDEWMAMAVVHSAEPGFRRSRKAVAV